jgi:Protein of unknown function (DUF3617)
MRVPSSDGLLICGIAFAMFAAPFSLYAQSAPIPVKPGLWESQISSTNQMALPPEVEARLAAMPAAQQAQVRSMMGGAGGGSSPVVTTTKSCVAGQTSMDSLLNQQQNRPGAKCTFTNRVQTADGASFDTSCTTAQGTATGHSTFHMTDDEHMSGTTHMTLDMSSNGKTMHSTIDSTYTMKYLGADCGDVKPNGPAVIQK